MALGDPIYEGLESLLSEMEERIARLERKDINRELIVNKIKVLKETFEVLEALTITTQAFCTFVCGKENWDATSTGLRVGFLQACKELWV